MDKFLVDVATPYFWLNVVLVGIVINLCSPLISRAFSAVLSKLSAKWRAGATAAALEERRLLEALVNKPSLMDGERDRALVLYARGTALTALAAFSLLLFFAPGLDQYRPAASEISIWGKAALAGPLLVILVTAVGSASEGSTRLARVLRAREALGLLLK